MAHATTDPTHDAHVGYAMNVHILIGIATEIKDQTIDMDSNLLCCLLGASQNGAGSLSFIVLFWWAM